MDIIRQLEELGFKNVSTTGSGNLGIDLCFQNKFKKDFVTIGIDDKKMQLAVNTIMTIAPTSENIEKLVQLDNLLNDLFNNAKQLHNQ